MIIEAKKLSTPRYPMRRGGSANTNATESNTTKYSLAYVKIDYLVGSARQRVPRVSADDEQLTQRQTAVLEDFRKRNLNILVSTPVLEEGIDVRQCNVVIRFDAPNNFAAYIHSKGRARAAGSYFYLLTDTSTHAQITERVHLYHRIDRVLASKAARRPLLEEESVPPALLDRLLPPFSPHTPPEVRITENSQATVYWHTAIPLINRYCQKLPSDLFTRLVAECTEIECDVPHKGMFVARMQARDCRYYVVS